MALPNPVAQAPETMTQGQRFGRGGGATGNMRIEVEGLREFRAACRQLGETDAPFLRKALIEAGQILTAEARRALPGQAITAGHRSPAEAFKVRALGVRGKPPNLRFVVSVAHRGVRSYEFGRYLYTRESKQRGRIHAESRRELRAQWQAGGRGQPARPFLGVAGGGGAIAASQDRVEELLGDAIFEEAKRLGLEVDR